jgi:hypothetical protein
MMELSMPDLHPEQDNLHPERAQMKTHCSIKPLRRAALCCTLVAGVTTAWAVPFSITYHISIPFPTPPALQAWQSWVGNYSVESVVEGLPQHAIASSLHTDYRATVETFSLGGQPEVASYYGSWRQEDRFSISPNAGFRIRLDTLTLPPTAPGLDYETVDGAPVTPEGDHWVFGQPGQPGYEFGPGIVNIKVFRFANTANPVPVDGPTHTPQLFLLTDQITLQGDITAVPESGSTLMMLACGILGTIVLSRRMQRGNRARRAVGTR